MKALIVYYSHTGKTRQAAHALAQETGADICEAQEIKKLSGIGSFLIGCPQAMQHKARPIHPLEKDMRDYDKIIIMGPVWAGAPVPAVNSIIDALPDGKTVEFRIVSGGGKSKNHQITVDRAKARSCTVEGYVDLRG